MNELIQRNAVTREIQKNKLLYLLLIPGLIQLLLFKLLPLFGLVIAFQDYMPFLGILDSKWVGLKHFKQFISDAYFIKLIRNTVMLAFLNFLFVFPMPIIFSVFLNEVRVKFIKRSVQSFSLFPYFISSAVMVSILYTLLSPQGGIINQFISFIGLDTIFFMAEPGWFRPLYVSLNVWQLFGYSAIVYLAAISNIDPALYEAADMDGAGRWRKIFNITLPSLRNIIIVMFILAVGQFLIVDLDKILLMYNPSVYETADVIQSYVYRQAFAAGGFPNYSYGAAVGLFQSIVAFLLVTMSNSISKRFSESSLF